MHYFAFAHPCLHTIRAKLATVFESKKYGAGQAGQIARAARTYTHPQGTTMTTNVRKCSICRTSGHNKRTCPTLSDDVTIEHTVVCNVGAMSSMTYPVTFHTTSGYNVVTSRPDVLTLRTPKYTMTPCAVITYPVGKQPTCEGTYDESAQFNHRTMTYKADNSAGWGRLCEYVDNLEMMWDWNIEERAQWYEMRDLRTETPLVVECKGSPHEYGNGVECENEYDMLAWWATLGPLVLKARTERHNAYLATQAASECDGVDRKALWSAFKAQGKKVWANIRQAEGFMWDLVGELRARGFDIYSADGVGELVWKLDTVEHIPAPECTMWLTSDLAPADTTESLVTALVAEGDTLCADEHRGDYYVQGVDKTFIGDGNPSFAHIASHKRVREEWADTLRQAATRSQRNAKYAVAPHVGKDGTRSYRMLSSGKTYDLTRLETKVWAQYHTAMSDLWAEGTQRPAIVGKWSTPAPRTHINRGGLPLNTAHTICLPWGTVAEIVREARKVARITVPRPTGKRGYYRVAKWSTSGKVSPMCDGVPPVVKIDTFEDLVFNCVEIAEEWEIPGVCKDVYEATLLMCEPGHQ